MEDNKIVCTLAADNKKYNIHFSDDINIDIDTENDIDLTEFVKILTHKLLNKEKATLEIQTQKEPKLAIFVDTITEIVESFNSTIDELTEITMQ